MHQDDSTIEQSRPQTDQRRRESDATLLLIKELQRGVKSLDEKITYHHKIFRQEMEQSVERVFERAFPEGDPEGHRKHHELVIKREEERLEFWSSMRKEVSKYGLISVIGFLLMSAWQTFLQGPKK